MFMSDPTISDIKQILTDNQRFLIISHKGPDGDAVSSVLSLGLGILSLDKEVQMVIPDGIPHEFRDLPGATQVQRCISKPYDISIILDCSDLERSLPVLDPQLPDINIDHHISNVGFARFNLIEPEAGATAQILAAHFPDWGLPIDAQIAVSLLTGIVSDTLGFRTSNTTSQTLQISSDLMTIGANLNEVYQKVLLQRSFPGTQYWGFGLNRLQRKDRLVWTSLTIEDREKSNYPGNDDADLINILSSIEDTDISIIFVEQKKGTIKVSWRAQAGIDVSAIAVKYGGGGHPSASGAEIKGSLDLIQSIVLPDTYALLSLHSPIQTAPETKAGVYPILG
jgi:phosphoesterase RecJ-like protein